MGWFKKIGSKIKKGVKKITKKVPALKKVGTVFKKFVTPILSKIPVVGSVVSGVGMLKSMFNKKTRGVVSTTDFNNAFNVVQKQFPNADISAILKQDIQNTSSSTQLQNSSGVKASYMPYSSSQTRLTSSFDYNINRGFDNEPLRPGQGVYAPEEYDKMTEADKQRVDKGLVPIDPPKSNTGKNLLIAGLAAILAKKFKLI